jgi:transcription initiation factor TFIIIB Brf1 subunit/transcription initiation factor TFIIB
MCNQKQLKYSGRLLKKDSQMAEVRLVWLPQRSVAGVTEVTIQNRYHELSEGLDIEIIL